MIGTGTGKARRLLAALGLTGALMLGGCAYDDGYGYGGVSVGSGYYGGDPYWGSSYYRPGGYGGWYNDYYYPGTGYYVFDRGGKRYRWNDGQRRYWEGRRAERPGGWNRRDDDRRGNDGRNWQGQRRYDGRPDGRSDARPGRQWRNDGQRAVTPRVERPQRAVTPRVERATPSVRSEGRGNWSRGERGGSSRRGRGD
ncbi:hypothetical protein WG908_12425 [Sphingobium sp. AN641]|uniref:hypothetical protein n=1 Tax=Sphingobium sp. AN641 TaxID=3133443 RepID=UPI0030C1B97F